MNTRDKIKRGTEVALMLADSGYNVIAISFTMRTSIQIENPKGLQPPADVEFVIESQEHLHHKARIGDVEVVWLTDKAKEAA